MRDWAIRLAPLARTGYYSWVPVKQFQVSRAQTVQTTLQTGVYKSGLFFHVVTLANGFGEGDRLVHLAVPIAVMYPHLKASFTYKRPPWENCSFSEVRNVGGSWDWAPSGLL